MLHSCPTLWDPVDVANQVPVPGILQVRILEWVAMSVSNACKYAVASVMSDSVGPYRQQPSRLLCPQDSQGRNTGWVAISFSVFDLGPI